MNIAYVRRARDGRFKVVIKTGEGRKIARDILSYPGQVAQMIKSYSAMIADVESQNLLTGRHN